MTEEKHPVTEADLPPCFGYPRAIIQCIDGCVVWPACLRHMPKKVRQEDGAETGQD